MSSMDFRVFIAFPTRGDKTTYMLTVSHKDTAKLIFSQHFCTVKANKERKWGKEQHRSDDCSWRETSGTEGKAMKEQETPRGLDRKRLRVSK